MLVPFPWLRTPEGHLMPRTAGRSPLHSSGSHVERSIDIKRCFHALKPEAKLGSGNGDGWPHPGNNRTPPHQGNHLGGFRNGPGKKRVECLHRRNVEHQAFSLVPFHGTENFFLQKFDRSVIRVRRHGDHEHITNFNYGDAIIVHKFISFPAVNARQPGQPAG